MEMFIQKLYKGVLSGCPNEIGKGRKQGQGEEEINFSAASTHLSHH